MEVVAGLSLKNLRPRVWDRRSPEFVRKLTAVMISFDEFRRLPSLLARATDGGFPAVLGGGEGVRVFVDNGAFACLRRGDEPAVAEFREFVRRTSPAWYPVPADFIPRPTDSRRRQKDLFQRTISVLEAHAEDGFCPVVHAGPWLDRYMDALQRLGRTDRMAIGGLVPHLLNSKGARRRETIARMKRARREFPGKIHAFGIGGVVTLHLAAALGIDSADSSGWRQRAARGLVVLKGRGERMAVKLGSWKGRAIGEEEWAELGRCRCPACRRRGAEGLKAEGVEGFSLRAVHNLWIVLEEAALIDKHLAKGDFAAWSARRVRGNRMADLVALAREAEG
jgi:7-cyano-7-deazaguanine tRNA-ribosyltransferase